MSKPSEPPIWIALTLDRSGNDVRVSALGCGNESTAPRSLGPGLDMEALRRFTDSVRRAAMGHKALTDELRREAQAIHRALLQGDDIGTVLKGIQGVEKSRPVLVRLLIADRELQAVPWEALGQPNKTFGFLAISPDLLPARGVFSSEPCRSREVTRAVRVLAIAPQGDASLANLEAALKERLESGEVDWLKPLTGKAAQMDNMYQRLLDTRPFPNVLHFLGHGGIKSDGVPVLRLADNNDDEEHWLSVELLAEKLKPNFQNLLRLVVLEACEGAKPSAFASAAEILVRAGADAVVAFLWPVRADVASEFSKQIYRALTSRDHTCGDIARSMNDARLALLSKFENSAEALSPVLYLKGLEGKIFDFEGRKVQPPRPSVERTNAAIAIDPALANVLDGQFSLVLGDRWKDDRTVLTGFRDKLQQELVKFADTPPNGLPMSALAQRFALRRGVQKLGDEFQNVFGGASGPLIVRAIAPLLCAGVHTTLLRRPWLEEAIAEQQPNRTIYVIQPSDEGALIMKRERGAERWEEVEASTEGREGRHLEKNIDLKRDIVVLRPYRGYTPTPVYRQPLMTEDDYYLHLREIWSTDVLPTDLTNAILRKLNSRPALFLGLSMFTSHHRMLLHSLYAGGLPRESVAILEPDDQERKLWLSGAGLPGKHRVDIVLEMTSDALSSALLAMPAGDCK